MQEKLPRPVIAGSEQLHWEQHLQKLDPPYPMATKNPDYSSGLQPLRVGIVGAGYIAEFHARAIAAVPGVHLNAICDSNLENAKLLAAAWNVPDVYGSVEEMIQDAALDCVHILAPPDLHHALARKAIEAGLHVLLEKPMCTSSAEADDLINLAVRLDRVVAVSHNFMFLPAYQRLRRAVHSGALGPIDHLAFQYLFDLPQIRFGPYDTWMLRQPANLMLETGPHLFSMLVDLLGGFPNELTTVTDRTKRLPGGTQVYRRWRIQGTRDKTAITINVDFGVGFPQRTLSVRGLFGSATLDLDANTCVIDQRTPLDPDLDRFSRSRQIAKQLRSQAMRTMLDYVVGKLKIRARGNPYQNSIINSTRTFYEAVRKNFPIDSRISAQTGREVIACCEKVVAAASLPAETDYLPRVPVPLTGRPTVLVLGAGGFIGRELVRQLIDQGYVIRAMVRGSAPTLEEIGSSQLEIVRGDIRRKEDLARAIEGIEFVFHLAHAPARTWNEYLAKDVEPTRLIAQVCLDANVKRLIYTGTISSFYTGAGAGTITDGTALDPKINSRDYYSRAKALSEKILIELHREKHLPVVIARPAIVIGKGGTPFHWGVGRFSDLICEVWGDGQHPLPFVLVEDVAAALVKAIEVPGIEGRSYNLSDKPLLTARDYLAELECASGLKLDIRYVPIWRLYLADMAKWLVKVIVGHPDRIRTPTYRDWACRQQLALFDSAAARRDLAWEPARSAAELVAGGIKGAVQAWKQASD